MNRNTVLFFLVSLLGFASMGSAQAAEKLSIHIDGHILLPHASIHLSNDYHNRYPQRHSNHYPRRYSSYVDFARYCYNHPRARNCQAYWRDRRQHGQHYYGRYRDDYPRHPRRDHANHYRNNHRDYGSNGNHHNDRFRNDRHRGQHHNSNGRALGFSNRLQVEQSDNRQRNQQGQGGRLLNDHARTDRNSNRNNDRRNNPQRNNHHRDRGDYRK